MVLNHALNHFHPNVSFYEKHMFGPAKLVVIPNSSDLVLMANWLAYNVNRLWLVYRLVYNASI